MARAQLVRRYLMSLWESVVDGIVDINTHRSRSLLQMVGIVLGVASVVANYIEKPTYHYAVSTGIYILEPAVLQHLERGQRLDLPDLVLRLMRSGRDVNVYNFDGRWLAYRSSRRL